jgi:hypothetical protein
MSGSSLATNMIGVSSNLELISYLDADSVIRIAVPAYSTKDSEHLIGNIFVDVSTVDQSKGVNIHDYE